MLLVSLAAALVHPRSPSSRAFVTDSKKASQGACDVRTIAL